MLLHASHTVSGMMPRRCKNPKTVQPKQNPRANSRVAATTSTPSTICAAGPKPSTLKISATVETTNPMPCAKRFGGPGTSLVFRQTFGAITRTDS